MSLQTKVIGRQPTDHGPYDPNLAYGKKFQCTLFGCAWESLHDNNNTAPAVWDGGDTITPNPVDWKKVSGDYEAWLMNQDKPAKSEEYPYNGMGRVRLKKNIVEVEEGGETVTKNMLTQAMFEDGVGNPLTDTVFIIQYDFVLGENITIPANSILEFDGGSINGAHTITGANTGINAGLIKIFNTDITIDGTWNVAEAYPEWFGAKGDGVTDDTLAIQKTVDNCFAFNGIVVFSNSIYCISSTIVYNRVNRLTLKGGGRRKSCIEAISQMQCMLTSTADTVGEYSYLDCSNIQFNGNRSTTFYNSTTNHFNQESTSLAQNAIYMPYGLIYSTIRDVTFTNFDGFGVYADCSWLLLIDNTYFEYCGYGVFATVANSFKLTNSNFSYIRNIAVMVGTGNPVVQGCSLDVIGETAIVISSGAKGALVKGNYFEGCSTDGIDLHFDNSGIVTDIHPYIIIPGGSLSSFYENRKLVSGYPVSVSIEDSYIDGTEESNNKYFVVSTALVNSRIINTTSKQGNERTVLGFISKTNISNIKNVEISANRNTNGELFKKVDVLYDVNVSGYYHTGVYNIFTNDKDNSGILNDNLMRYLYLRNNTTNIVKETTTKYLGIPTFTAESNTSLYVSNLCNNYKSIENEVFDNKIVIISWYDKQPNADEWVLHSNYYYGNIGCYIGLSAGVLITMPTVYIAGEQQQNVNNTEILPIAVGLGLYCDASIHYLPLREVNVLNNDYCNKANIIYDNNDINNTPEIIGKLKSINTLKSKLGTLLYYYGAKYKGISVIENNKPIWWNGTEWVDATGTPV